MSVLLFVIGIVLFFIKKEYAIVYYICWIFFFPYIMDMLSLTNDYKALRGFANYYLSFVALSNMLKNRSLFQNKRFANSTLLFLCLVILLMFFSIYHMVDYSHYITFCISNFLPPLLLFYLINSTPSCNFRLIRKLVWSVCVIELVISILQINFSILIPIKSLENTMRLNMSNASGTLFGNNTLGSILILLSIILLSWIDFNKKNIFKILFLLLSVLYVIVQTGIRTYLICYILFVPIVLFFKIEKRTIYVLTSVMLVIVGLSSSIFNNTSGYSTKDATNSVERQIYGIAYLNNSGIDGSTLSLSSYLMSYFKDNPLLGNGLLYTNAGYGVVSRTNQNTTDATLMLYTVEFGFIGIVYMIFVLFKICLSDFKNIYQLLCFIFLLIATITDAGLFSMINLSILILFVNNDSDIGKYSERFVR